MIPLFKSVTLDPWCHQAQGTYTHKTAQVWQAGMELHGTLSLPLAKDTKRTGDHDGAQGPPITGFCEQCGLSEAAQS